MTESLAFCLIFWCIGGILVAASLLNWRFCWLSYLLTFSWGKRVSRIFAGILGLILLGVGFMIFLAK